MESIVRMMVLLLNGALLLAASDPAAAAVTLEGRHTQAGYLARLLINETPFPGERGWVSESDTRAAMVAILYVLDSRLNNIPPGYDQKQVAAVRATDVIDVITAGGEKGQCDGFYRDERGQFMAVTRVHQRIDRLVVISNQGTPGRFARLLKYAQDLARAYLQGGIEEVDRFAGLTRVGPIRVTGRAYSWMAGKDCYHPGGHFVRISNEQEGLLGGNRFFTLKKKEP